MSTAAGDPVGAAATFADTLKALRTARSLTQGEVADRARLTVKAVGALERGERRHPYPHTVRSLADALGLDGDERASLVAALPDRGGSREPAPAADTAEPSSTVPVPPELVVGRDDDVATVTRLLREPTRRVVTLSGPGGVGKTTLALLAAARAADAFPDGVSVVELADVGRADAVWQAVAAALRVPDLTGAVTVDVVARHLRGRRLLLVLDNLEHLLACGPQLSSLVAHRPELVVLVTSRAPLRIRPEREVRVAPLDRDTATRLFRERVAASGATLDEGADTVAAVDALVTRADGLPLAVELAASATALFGPSPLLGRLGELTAPRPRDLPARQGSMDATILWSDELLAPAARTLLRRLSVCVGGFSLAVVDELGDGPGGEPVRALADLLDHSLVVRLPDVVGTARFRLLVPVRRFAEHQLAAADRLDALDRLARSVLATTAGLVEDLGGPDQVVAMRLLDADAGNIRSTVEHLLATGTSDARASVTDLVWGLSLHLVSRGRVREASSWVGRLTSQDGLPGARALTASSTFHLAGGDLDAARSAADAAIEAAVGLGDDGLAAEAGLVAATSAIRLDDLDDARALLDEVGRRDLGGRPRLSVHLRLTRAQLLRASEDRELVTADVAAAEAETAARALGANYEVAFALNMRALIRQAQGRVEESAPLLAESVERCADAADVWLLVHTLPAAARLAVAQGQLRAAVQLSGAAATLAQDAGLRASFALSRRVARDGLDAARAGLGTGYDAAWEAGRAAVLGEVLALARAVAAGEPAAAPADR